MTTFRSIQFPNIKANGIQFENGYYITDKENEITILKKLGFEIESSNIEEKTKRPITKKK